MYLPMLVAAVAAMVVGAAWYSPSLFGKMWMKEAHMTEADMKKAKEKGMTSNYVIEFVGKLLMVYVFVYLIKTMGIMDLNGVAMLAFWLWLGLKLPVTLSRIAWEQKTWNMILLDAHSLVSMVVAGWILVAWKV